MELVARGAQDVYLTGSPQISFFKVVYRRHTNFSCEDIEQSFDGNADFGRTVSCNINRNGDLVSDMNIVVKINTASSVSNFGADKDFNHYIYDAATATFLTKSQLVDESGFAGSTQTIVKIGGSNYYWTTDLDTAEGDLTGGVEIFYISNNAITPYDFAIASTETLTGYIINAMGFVFSLTQLSLLLQEPGFFIREASTTGTMADDPTEIYSFNAAVAATSAEINDRYVRHLGWALIDEVSISIGGTTIDKHYGDWLNIWHELSHDTSHDEGYENTIKTADTSGIEYSTANEQLLYIPLQFWFCRNEGLSLPLIALQYHDVRVTVKFNSYSNLITNKNITADFGTTDFIVTTDTVSFSDAFLLTNYIYLDSEERKRFAQASHEYLIEQIQFNGGENASNLNEKYRLDFNHPCKFLAWVGKDNSVNGFSYDGSGLGDGSGTNTVSQAVLELNGHDRFAKRDGNYFNYVQPIRHFSNTPMKGINVYSFSRIPEDHQPSGTCNFSRIDNAILNIKFANASVGVCNIYTMNYNILRIMSGMGGLAYSN